MGVQVPSIDLEIQPIEGKGLDQAQHCLAEEGVDAHGRRVLEQESDDGVAKDQRDKGVRPLGLVLDVCGRDEIEILGHARGDGARFDLLVQIVLHQHDGDTAEQVEQDGRPNQCKASWVLDLDGCYPQNTGDQDTDSIGQHVAADGGKDVAHPQIVRSIEQTRGQVESDELNPCGLESLDNVQGIAEETDHVKEDADALEDVIDLEPADHEGDVAPHLPPEDEGNGKFEQAETSGFLSCRVPDDGDDAHIEQIHEQLKGADLIDLRSPPEETAVEILPHDGLPPEGQGHAELTLRIPVALLRHGAGGGVRVPGADVGVVAEFGEVGVEGDAVIGQHVELIGKEIEVGLDPLEFVVDVGVLRA